MPRRLPSGAWIVSLSDLNFLSSAWTLISFRLLDLKYGTLMPRSCYLQRYRYIDIRQITATFPETGATRVYVPLSGLQ